MAGAKRKHSEDSPEQLYTNKSRSKPSAEARVDPTYGQRSAIPGLDDYTIIDGLEDGLSYGEDMDALAYLRAVREEAIGIPNLLVAPKETVDEYGRDPNYDGSGFSNGYYEDGAYYTSDPLPASSDDTKEDGEVGSDPQLAYFDSILTRYEALREQLSQTPPVEAIGKLDEDHPTYLGKLNTENARWWRWNVRAVDPLPVQVACMDKATVLNVLRLMTGGTLLKRGAMVDVGVSRWAWGLLARLPERGELTSEEVGVVRDLGKKAVLVGMGLREDTEWDEGMDEVEAVYTEDNNYGDGSSYTNREEIQLDIDMDEDIEDIDIDLVQDHSNGKRQQIGPQLASATAADTVTGDINKESRKLEASSNGDTANLSENVNGTEVQQHETGDVGFHGQSDLLEKCDQEEADIRNDIAAAKARILARLREEKAAEEHLNHEDDISNGDQQDMNKHAELDPETSKWNTRATVDMIITVAGEIFGQRDLLEFRSIWSEAFLQ